MASIPDRIHVPAQFDEHDTLSLFHVSMLTLAERYEDFQEVTKRSLRHTLAEHELEMTSTNIDKIMQAYDNLSTFEDVVPALQKLGATKDVECVVFSNGTPTMIKSSVNNSSDLSPVSGIFSHLVSVDHIRSFKPAPAVYRHLIECVGMVGRESSVWLVSGNPFDVVGARAIGLNAAWVDRAGNGWQDRLGLEQIGRAHV